MSLICFIFEINKIKLSAILKNYKNNNITIGFSKL
jgi:hypothetical protein